MVDKSYLLELTQAEKEATEIIRSAQEARDKRLKEAKFDAEQELGNYRKQLETEYNEAAEKDAHGIDPELQELQEEYRRKANEVKGKYNQNKNEAIETLVNCVFQVNIEVPKVVIGKFD